MFENTGDLPALPCHASNTGSLFFEVFCVESTFSGMEFQRLTSTPNQPAFGAIGCGSLVIPSLNSMLNRVGMLGQGFNGVWGRSTFKRHSVMAANSRWFYPTSLT